MIDSNLKHAQKREKINNTFNEEAAILHSNPFIIITFSVAIHSAVDSLKLAYFCIFLHILQAKQALRHKSIKILSRKPIYINDPEI